MEDCYFFLYSECKLKERCMYRHNPMSKDNLITCRVWKKTKKCRIDCPLRHSEYHELKHRNETMCYWEDKGGCTKYRCEYKHKDPVKDDWKEIKVKSLSEIKNLKTTIEIENEKKITNIDYSCSDINTFGDAKSAKDSLDYITTEEHADSTTNGELLFDKNSMKCVKTEVMPQEFEDLDKELQELDSLLNDSD